MFDNSHGWKSLYKELAESKQPCYCVLSICILYSNALTLQCGHHIFLEIFGI